MEYPEPVACAYIPNFALGCALGADPSCAGPLALAPEPGGAQLIGECSPAAQALGIREGMRLAEALAHDHRLKLVQIDEVEAHGIWEEFIRRLEGMGLEVESPSPGEAYFELGGVRKLIGGAEEVLRSAAKLLPKSTRLASAPGRFCSRVAVASGDRVSVPPDQGARFLAPFPIATLAGKIRSTEDGSMPPGEVQDLPNELERLGVATLGELAALPSKSISDRFGHWGSQARKLARGFSSKLRPRTPRQRVSVQMELHDGASREHLGAALDRLAVGLLSHPGLEGKLRSVVLDASYCSGASVRREVKLRTPTLNRQRLGLAMRPHLEALTEPVERLSLQAGETTGDRGEATGQLSFSSPEDLRRLKLADAVRQTRAVVGVESVLRVLEIDPHSRIPERRAVLVPHHLSDEMNSTTGRKKVR